MSILNESPKGTVKSNVKPTSKRRRNPKSAFARVNERFEQMLKIK